MSQSRIVKFLIVILLIPVSCNDYLDKTPDEDLTIDEVFSERRYAENFLTSVYHNLPPENVINRPRGKNPYVSASDEMELPWSYAFSQRMNSGAWNSSFGAIAVQWRALYEGIRKANIFLNNVEQVPMDEDIRQRWIGEATFLRAFYHFWLARAYGPVPITDKAYDTDANFAEEVKRAPINEVISFIVSECDKAISLLPMHATPNNLGRATKAAALALKSRALLYMASPLWNGNEDYSGFTNSEGEDLFPEFEEERWKQAADAAREAINQVEAGGYHLYQAADGDPMKSYQEIFLEDWNDEILFARNLGVNGHLERLTTPNGMGGYSGLNPTQKMIDSYEMENGDRPIAGYNDDGSPIINSASGYEETGYVEEADPDGYYPSGIHKMYANREPRFYASINYNGAMWRGRRIEFWVNGLDGRGSGGPDFSITGYTMKKYSDPNVNIPQGRFAQTTWIYFRLAELYLNYAEALNEYEGPTENVYNYINAIRNRAGLPNLETGLSQDEMRARIRHERKIELAFETHRYFDTHRWKIANQTQSGNIYGMNINSGNSLQDDSFYQRTFIEERIFTDPKHYLFPIPQAEIDKNINIVQNPGW